jgi:hypothetical protein
MKPALATLAMELAACQPQWRSAAYFEAHPAEAARAIAVCKDSPRAGV